MNKNYNYYSNRSKYYNVCVPRRGGILNYLIKEKFLSEFSTEEEKLEVLENLGIISRLKLLQQNINNKADMSLLRRYVTEVELARRLEELKPKDEKSKGYFSSYQELLVNFPYGSTGDWAIVNNEGVWYIYSYKNNHWEQGDVFQTDIDLSDYAKLADLEFFQEVLVSSYNIKTINGQTILGEGNLEIKEPLVSEENDGIISKEFYVELLLLLNRVVPGLQEQVEIILNDSHLEEELNSLTRQFNELVEQIEEGNIGNFEQRIQSNEESIRQLSQSINNLNNKIDNIDVTPKDSVKHVFITQAEYDALETYERNTLYLIVEYHNTEKPGSHFGDTFPFVLGGDSNSNFGDTFPLTLV